jgi:XisH protein
MAKDKIHYAVKNALIKDGWLVTHDPYKLKVLDVEQEIDLGAEEILAAERAGRRIAVEVKSFIKGSFINEFHGVLGQYLNYEMSLEEQEIERILYVAVPSVVYEMFFHKQAIQKAINRFAIRLIIVDTQTETIKQWIEQEIK